MHYLPPVDSPLRDLFSVALDLVPLGTGHREPTLFREALAQARVTFASSPAVRRVTCIAMRANDDLVLMQIGPRGGHKCLWNFTTGKRSY